MSVRISEIVLLVVLVLIAGLTRVYYGTKAGPMVVWKGELAFKDTLVNLDEILKLPPKELVAEHQSVAFQLQDMGVLRENGITDNMKRHRPHARPMAPLQENAPASQGENKPKPGGAEPDRKSSESDKNGASESDKNGASESDKNAAGESDKNAASESDKNAASESDKKTAQTDARSAATSGDDKSDNSVPVGDKPNH